MGSKIKEAFMIFYDAAVYDEENEFNGEKGKIRESLRTIIE